MGAEEATTITDPVAAVDAAAAPARRRKRIDSVKRVAEACRRLGIRKEDIILQPQITPQLATLARQVQRKNPHLPTDPIYYLSASDAPEARQVLQVYYSLVKSGRKLLPIEAFCLAAGVPTPRVHTIIVESMVKISQMNSAALAAIFAPSIVDKTIESGLSDGADAHADRNTIHKATGFLPSPKGAKTIIQVNASAAANADAKAAVLAPTAAPPPEQTIRALAEKFNAARLQGAGQPALPTATTEPINIPAREAASDLIEVAAGADSDDDDSDSVEDED